MDFKIT